MARLYDECLTDGEEQCDGSGPETCTAANLEGLGESGSCTYIALRICDGSQQINIDFDTAGPILTNRRTTGYLSTTGDVQRNLVTDTYLQAAPSVSLAILFEAD